LTFFWLSGAESVQTFVFGHIDVLAPLTLGAWTVAWSLLLGLKKSRAIAIVAAGLTVLYAAAEFVKRPSFDGGFAKGLAPAAATISKWDRYAFIALLVYIVYRGFRERGAKVWVAIPAIALVAVGLFSAELSKLGVPTIWFPFGMGVSLSNYAYLFATIAIAVLLWSRLWSFDG
jgi:hypothetical protein